MDSLPQPLRQLAQSLSDLRFKYRDAFYDWKTPADRFFSHSLLPSYMDVSSIRDEDAEELAKKIQQKQKRWAHSRKYSYHKWETLSLVSAAYIIEARKELIGELEESQRKIREIKQTQRLTKSKKKEVRKRTNILRHLIKQNTKGTQEIFVSEKEARNLARTQGMNSIIMDWTTEYPILRFGRNYQKHLDILEELGVPNVSLLRSLPQSVKNIFDSQDDSRFLSRALSHLVVNGADALEDVVRLAPLFEDTGRGSMMPFPSLSFLQFDKKYHEEVRRLGISSTFARKLPKIGTNHWNSDAYGYIRNKLLLESHDFYFEQLSHPELRLRFAAVRALVAPLTIEKTDRYFSVETRGERREREQEQRIQDRKSRQLFNETDIPQIISSLGLESRYPQLTKHPQLIARRIERIKSYEALDSVNAYEFSELEDALIPARNVRPVLRALGVSFTLDDICSFRQIEGVAQSLQVFADLAQEENVSILSNKYFRQGFTRYGLLRQLEHNSSSKKTDEWLQAQKDIALKLSELEGEHASLAQMIADNIYYGYREFTDKKKQKSLDFISIAPRLDLTSSREVQQAMRLFADYIDEDANLTPEQRKKALENFRYYRRFAFEFGEREDINMQYIAHQVMPHADDVTQVQRILQNGFLPTPHLVERLARSSNKERELAYWKSIDANIRAGEFSLGNELHTSLEYRRFIAHMQSVFGTSQNIGFGDFMTLFQTQKPTLSKKAIEEIDYMCVEANQLLQFITQSRAQASEVGRDVIVVGNYTYGNVAMLPIEDILRLEGVDITKTKIGSTECHGNTEYLKSRLFRQAVAQKILQEQPSIIVVDGTAHLQGYEKGARYPDAHRGFLNHGLAFNSLLTGNAQPELLWRGQNSDPHSSQLQKEIEYLRFCANTFAQRPQGYEAAFWNPANNPLQIRSAREVVAQPKINVDPRKPQLVITNTTMTHNDIRGLHPLLKGHGEHMPAFFDDTSIAKTSTAVVTEHGVQYTNIMRDTARERYQALYGSHK